MIRGRLPDLPGVIATVGLAVLATTCIGCGRPRISGEVVHGTVTFAGRPVPAGLIRFEPALALGNRAPMGEAVIRDGLFRTEPGRSPARGAYRARLIGGDGIAPDVSPAARADPDFERIGAGGGVARPLGKEWFRDYVMELEITGDGQPLDIDVPLTGASR